MNLYARHLDETQAMLDDEYRKLRPKTSGTEEGKKLIEDMTLMLNKTQNNTLNESNLDDVLQRMAVVQEQQAHHLPVLNMEKFNGDITTFYAWREEFKVNIHERTHMSNSQKFTYLRNLLEGEAADSIESTPATGANYNQTLNYLFSRYRNPETIAIEIFTRLLVFPKFNQNHEVGKLKKYFDKVNSYVITPNEVD